MNQGTAIEAVLGVVGFIIASLLSLVMALIAYINREQRREQGAEIKDLKEKNAKLEERVQKEELATSRLDGEMKLVKSEHAGLVDDIHDVKKSMVTKVEFETRMNNQDRLLGMVLLKLDGTKYPSQGGMPATRAPESVPPRRGG